MTKFSGSRKVTCLGNIYVLNCPIGNRHNGFVMEL